MLRFKGLGMYFLDIILCHQEVSIKKLPHRKFWELLVKLRSARESKKNFFVPQKVFIPERTADHANLSSRLLHLINHHINYSKYGPLFPSRTA